LPEGHGEEAAPEEVLTVARRMLEVLLNRGVAPAAAVLRVVAMPPLNEYPSLVHLLGGQDPSARGRSTPTPETA
jgi:hypothetical protein